MIEKDDSNIPAKVISDAIKDIRTHSAWMLGILVVIILPLVGFIFSNFGAEAEVGSFLWVAKRTAILLCIFHLALLLYYIQPLMAPDFEDLTHESDAERLRDLIRNFKTLLYLFVISVLASFAYGFGLWVFTSFLIQVI